MTRRDGPAGGPVLVTGAGGFVGGHLVERLARDAPVIASGRGEPLLHIPSSRWYPLDLLNRAAVRTAIAEIRPAVVYHCAGFAHVAESWSDRLAPLETNVLATHHLLDALARAGHRCRVLVAGSAAVYAPSPVPLDERAAVAPKSPYAVSKLAQEQLALTVGREGLLDVVVARAFNHTGPRQSPTFFAPAMAKQLALIETGRAAPVIRTGNLDAERDLSDVRDVVEAYVALARSAAPGIYNVASGERRSMRAVLDLLLSLGTVQVRCETAPERLRPGDAPSLVGDASRLKAETGWQPTVPFTKTLADLLDYWRDAVAHE